MKLFKRLFRLPSPVDLGRADHDALPSRHFSPELDEDIYTWEDYYEEMKATFPIKYWITETAPQFLRYKVWFPVYRPIKNTHYWLVSHLIPSRRYHMLDLRQPGGYRYGWQDVPEKMLFAIFNLLKEYLKEEPYDVSKGYSLEEINADPSLKSQHEQLQEVHDILHWWDIERKEEEKRINELCKRWSELQKDPKTRENGQAQQMFVVYQKAEGDYEEKLDDILRRVIKIRRSLWT